jgi:hypothetical protein
MWQVLGELVESLAGYGEQKSGDPSPGRKEKGKKGRPVQARKTGRDDTACEMWRPFSLLQRGRKENQKGVVENGFIFEVLQARI